MGYVGRYLSVIYVFVLGNFINISYAWNITNHFGTDIAQVVPYIVAILPFLVAVPVVLFIRRGKALPIQMFYFNQVIIAISAVFLSICLPMIMTPFPIRSLTTTLAVVILHCPPVYLLCCISIEVWHLVSPIQYTFPKTTRLSNLQKFKISAFFFILETYYYYTCSRDLNHWPTNILILTAINIMTIPALFVAFYACNADSIHSSRVQSGGGLIVTRKWIMKGMVWNLDHGPDEHEDICD
ncbi:Serpentine Receptor, class T [Caenorhabditis elegans]|uniref:Serpentine Receptor, class T n=1 Tax=Caenorhabditis elegans TaxID=6239 RepID=G5EFU1_CAEEL|nr:Serpentine Receptor, class T [Caenorhabditis elegans]CAA19553.1 Serpentine Receptor, class T [Caenorhabditis elegans]|eukprot:NP_496635.1 Uncharacterized protein CELE_Y57A10C.1 [Caenorhabditis elegans]